MADIKKILIIDDDELCRNLIANHCGKLGIDRVDHFENGHEGSDAINRERYDFIVLDWKLSGISGLALFNRIRCLDHYRTTPLLVVSGFLEKFDFRLLQEFPCTGLMEKPFTKNLFQIKFDELVRENTWYTQNNALIDSLVEAVEHDAKKAESLIKQVLKQSPNPIPLALIAARRMVKARMLKNAENILRGVLKVDETCLIAMNELAKILHIQGRNKEALQTLAAATQMSPENISRLCLMGELELNLQDADKAKSYFEKALAIDSESPTAKAGIVVARNMKEAIGQGSPTHLTASFASILNTLGVSLVRDGQYARGVEQYQSAMAFLHSDTDSARVAFNLGLGFLRWGKPEKALPWFQKSATLAPKSFGKSASYINKLLERGDVGTDEIMDPVTEPGFGKVETGKDKAGRVAEAEVDNVIPFPQAEHEDHISEERVGTATSVRIHRGD